MMPTYACTRAVRYRYTSSLSGLPIQVRQQLHGVRDVKHPVGTCSLDTVTGGKTYEKFNATAYCIYLLTLLLSKVSTPS